MLGVSSPLCVSNKLQCDAILYSYCHGASSTLERSGETFKSFLPAQFTPVTNDKTLCITPQQRGTRTLAVRGAAAAMISSLGPRLQRRDGTGGVDSHRTARQNQTHSAQFQTGTSNLFGLLTRNNPHPPKKSAQPISSGCSPDSHSEEHSERNQDCPVSAVQYPTKI